MYDDGMVNAPPRLKLLAPAKINLFLHIIDKRPDGYHNLKSLMCCIDLCDQITLLPGMPDTSVRCRHPDVPEDATNLAARAAEVFHTSMGLSGGAGVIIDKKIPVGAGLGGGSSNAAVVLTALNRYYGKPFSRGDLMAMGLSIGADVPFFIYGKPAMVSGIGETVEPYGKLLPYAIVLIFPGIGVSTPAVYKNLNLALTKSKNKHNYRDLSDYQFRVRNELYNDLETVAIRLCPEIQAAKDALLIQGAIGALMSGSGSSVFGVFPDPQAARKAVKLLRQHKKWQVFFVAMHV